MSRVDLASNDARGRDSYPHVDRLTTLTLDERSWYSDSLEDRLEIEQALAQVPQDKAGKEMWLGALDFYKTSQNNRRHNFQFISSLKKIWYQSLVGKGPRGKFGINTLIAFHNERILSQTPASSAAANSQPAQRDESDDPQPQPEVGSISSLQSPNVVPSVEGETSEQSLNSPASAEPPNHPGPPFFNLNLPLDDEGNEIRYWTRAIDVGGNFLYLGNYLQNRPARTLFSDENGKILGSNDHVNLRPPSPNYQDFRICWTLNFDRHGRILARFPGNARLMHRTDFFDGDQNYFGFYIYN